ncbi:MAG: YbaK/EbsC family protein [Candidatus Krumholzibacteriia bacterium]
MPCEKLLEFLDEHRVPYELVEHPHAFAARETARKAGVPGYSFAKTVLVQLDGLMAMAVLPSESKVNFNLLRSVANVESVGLASESEFESRFPDCELGAMPPFGNLYNMRVFVDGHLQAADTIAFNAGTHTEIIMMPYEDFESLVRPTIGQFTFRPLQEMPGMA